MKYAIIEDEYLCQSHLYKIITALRPAWELQFMADSIESTLWQIESSGIPDLIFMDIELSDGK